MTRAFFLLAAALAACFGPPCLLAQIPSPPPPSRSIGGTVRLYDGRIPDFRVPVKLYMANQMLVDETFTDSSGRFEFQRLRGETFHIVVQVRGYEPVTEIVSLEIVLAARLPPLTLTPTPSPDDSYPPPEGLVSALDLSAPKHAKVAYEKGRREIDRGNPANAREHLAQAVKLYPEYFLGHYWLGLAHLMLNEWEPASKLLERAIELNPQAHEPYLALGKAFNQLDQPQKAKEVTLRGTELSPATAALWVELGRAELSLGEFAAAIEHAQRAQQLTKEPPTELYLIVANSCLKLGRYPEAKLALQQFLQADPQSPSAPKAREVLEKMKRAGILDPKP